MTWPPPADAKQGLQTEPEHEEMMSGVRAATEDEDRFLIYCTTVSVVARA